MFLLFIGGAVLLLVLVNSSTAGSIQEADSLPQDQANQFVKSIAQAIAQAEGFYVEDSKSQRQNNPGDITSLGIIKTFDTEEQGWEALYGEINLILAGRSHFYAPTDPISVIATKWTTDVPPGAQAAWSANVARALGVSPETSFAEYIIGQTGTSI